MNWVKVLSKLGPLIGLAFVMLIFSTLNPARNTFLTVNNFELILRQAAVIAIAALGMTLIIISGGIDLSIGSAAAFTTVVIALMLSHQKIDTQTGDTISVAGVSPWIAAIVGIAAGALIGLVNGALITRLKMVPFIITLGTMSILRGSAQGLASNTMVYLTKDSNQTWLTKIMRLIDTDRVWLLTPGTWLMLVLAVAVAAMLRYTRFGRHVFAIGSNEQTARLCGVPVDRTKLLIYVLAGALVGIASVLQFSYLSMGDPTTSVGLELDVIAAVVIGGASLTGGQGTILGSIVGALIIQTVANGCTKMGWENWVQQVVTGGIIILAVALDRWRQRLGEPG